MTKVLLTRHVLAVNDLKESAGYFIEKLGFTRDFSDDGWEFLSLDTFRVMLGECPDEVPARETNNHSYFAYVEVDNVDALCRGMKERGAEIIHDLEDKPWAMREFGVITPEGHRIMFGQDIKQERASENVQNY